METMDEDVMDGAPSVNGSSFGHRSGDGTTAEDDTFEPPQPRGLVAERSSIRFS